VSLGVKAALADTGVPRVAAVGADGGTMELELAEDGGEDKLNWQPAPCLVTLSKVNYITSGFALHGSNTSKDKHQFI
jgi:exosome complex RNA-binding protein Rrp42 (RNase PH superfamily)